MAAVGNYLYHVGNQEVVVYEWDCSEDVEGAIEAINSSQQDLSWKNDTTLIKNKYLYSKFSYLTFKLLKEGDSVIGYSIARSLKGCTKVAYLAFLAIHQEHQSKGKGSTLLLATIQDLKAKEITSLALDCGDEALLFYIGFCKL